VRAVVLHKTGGPEELVVEDAPEPALLPEVCVVRVRAAGVCGRDLIDRRGDGSLKRFPIIPGHEFSGDIIRMGSVAEAESGLRVGDRVLNLHRPSCRECPTCRAKVPMVCERAWQSFGSTIDGAYGEMIAAHYTTLVKMPDALPYTEASTLMCTAGVALQGLRARGRLAAQETVLVTGASGGVGGAAVQIARALGANVIATTTNEAKARAIKALGAHEVIVSPDGRFSDEVKKKTGGGVDVALDCTGPPTFGSSLRSLRKAGRLVAVGNLEKMKVEINLGAVIVYGYEILGSPSCTRQDLDDVLAFVKDGAVRPRVDRTLPLERAAEAHRLLAARAVAGRVVLVP
jgi:D-arabinose 1-dehydrogenase-like Zn-dependent alcohol dehydrogenase